MNVKHIKSCLFILFLTCSLNVLGQNKAIDSLIKVKASSFFIDELNIPDAIVYSKTNGEQVYIEHRGIKMWCDQALLYKTDNFIRALGNVRMNQGDTLTLVSEFAEYNGTSQLAFANGKVKMTNPDTTLETDSLFFDRKKQQAYYRSGGTVRDTASTLRSRIGRYFIEENKYQFLDQVVVTNKEYTINSNHLNFYSETGHAYLYGPSTITSSTSKVYCERGFYDTRKDTGYFVKNSRIDYNNRTIWGDSLYFDRNRSFASATNNIVVQDTLNNSLINGHYAEVYRAKDSVFITKRAVAISTQDQDSVYIHADTLMVTGPEDRRVIRGFYDARLFKKDLSGKADSIISIQSQGITKMITKPILWSNNSQITGDSIFLYGNNKNEKLDSLHVFYNAFMIDQDTSGGFNQIKGKELKGFFNDLNEIKTIRVDRNVENLIYSRDEDNLLIGINKGTSGRMIVDFEDREIVMITTLDNPEDKTYPPEELPENVRKLRDFRWRGEEAMITRNDLFAGKEPPVLPVIKGIPPPKIEIDFFESLKNIQISDKSRIQREELKTRTGDQSSQTQKILTPLEKDKQEK